MNIRIMAPVFFAFLFSSASAFAVEGSVTISSPADGAVVSPKDDVEVNYEAVPGPEGDHLHLYLDGKRIDVLHQMQGKAEIGMLDPGAHQICLAVNTKGHVPTGAEKCINVTSK